MCQSMFILYKDDTVKCKINERLALHQSKLTNVRVIEWGGEIVPVSVNLVQINQILLRYRDGGDFAKRVQGYFRSGK